MPKPAYFIFDTTVKNRDGMKPYAEKVEATVTAFGGKRVVMGGRILSVEGTAPKGSLVILQFPNLAAATAWYGSAEYQAILGYRLAAADCNAYVVEGTALAIVD